MTKNLVVAASPWGQAHGDIGSFHALFSKVIMPTESLKGADALLLWGGTDIHPSFYKQKHHPYNGSDTNPSQRDLTEWQMMHDAKAKGIPIIGVCRGAQFMCAFAGGSLFQHTQGHNKNHYVETADGRRFFVTSSHHQMMNPFDGKLDYELLAWSSDKHSPFYEEEEQGKSNVRQENRDTEPEVIYFNDVGIACQPHPEWMTNDAPFCTWLNENIIKYCFAN